MDYSKASLNRKIRQLKTTTTRISTIVKFGGVAGRNHVDVADIRRGGDESFQGTKGCHNTGNSKKNNKYQE